VLALHIVLGDGRARDRFDLERGISAAKVRRRFKWRLARQR